MRLARALLFALALGAATPAAAEVSLQDLSGRWAVQTQPHRISGCVIQGEAQAAPNPDGDALLLDLTVSEQCPGGASWRVTQACRGKLADTGLRVVCFILEAVPGNYVPDAFTLETVSASFMSGRLNDGSSWDEPVEWRRIRPPRVS